MMAIIKRDMFKEKLFLLKMKHKGDENYVVFGCRNTRLNLTNAFHSLLNTPKRRKLSLF